METECYYYPNRPKPYSKIWPPKEAEQSEKNLKKPEQFLWLLIIHLEVRTEIFSSIVSVHGKRWVSVETDGFKTRCLALKQEVFPYCSKGSSKRPLPWGCRQGKKTGLSRFTLKNIPPDFTLICRWYFLTKTVIEVSLPFSCLTLEKHASKAGDIY